MSLCFKEIWLTRIINKFLESHDHLLPSIWSSKNTIQRKKMFVIVWRCIRKNILITFSSPFLVISRAKQILLKSPIMIHYLKEKWLFWWWVHENKWEFGIVNHLVDFSKKIIWKMWYLRVSKTYNYLPSKKVSVLLQYTWSSPRC